MRNKRKPKLIFWFLLFIVSIAVIWIFSSKYFITLQVPEQTLEIIAPEAIVLEVIVPKVVVPEVITVPQGEIRLIPIPKKVSLNTETVHAFFDGKKVPVFDYSGRVYTLVPVSAQKSVGTYNLEIFKDEQIIDLLPIIITRKEFPEDVLNIPYEFVEFPKQVQDNIREIKQPFLEALQKTSETRRWSTGFSYPLDVIDITDFFGKRRVYTNYTTPFHNGVDLRATSGTSVYSVSGGQVLWGGDSKLYFEGNAVVVDHGQEIISMYLHLDSVKVEAGDKIERNQILGRSGASGFGTGPHLHFAVKVGGEYVDPLQFIEAFQDVR